MLSVCTGPQKYTAYAVCPTKHGDNLSTTNQWGPMVTHNTVLKAAPSHTCTTSMGTTDQQKQLGPQHKDECAPITDSLQG